jgi:hypothetical protein
MNITEIISAPKATLLIKSAVEPAFTAFGYDHPEKYTATAQIINPTAEQIAAAQKGELTTTDNGRNLVLSYHYIDDLSDNVTGDCLESIGQNELKRNGVDSIFHLHVDVVA